MKNETLKKIEILGESLASFARIMRTSPDTRDASEQDLKLVWDELETLMVEEL